MLKRINFQSIPVTDYDRAIGFYRDILGMNVQTDAALPEGERWIFMQIPGSETMLQFGSPNNITITGAPALYLVCDDVDAEAARLKAVGVVIDTDATDAPWHPGVRFALIRDTEGNQILLQSSSMET